MTQRLRVGPTRALRGALGRAGALPYPDLLRAMYAEGVGPARAARAIRRALRHGQLTQDEHGRYTLSHDGGDAAW